RHRHVLALRLAQVEGVLEDRDQDLVAGGHEAPEEEHGDQDEALRPAGLLGRHGAAVEGCVGGGAEPKWRRPDSPSGRLRPVPWRDPPLLASQLTYPGNTGLVQAP